MPSTTATALRDYALEGPFSTFVARSVPPALNDGDFAIPARVQACGAQLAVVHRTRVNQPPKRIINNPRMSRITGNTFANGRASDAQTRLALLASSRIRTRPPGGQPRRQ